MRNQLRKPAAKGGQTRGKHPGAAPVIPDKLYFRIGEVARLCGVETYVLRFWESEFPQLKPTKSGTGQRLYRKRDVETALKIKHLLYEEGYTIPGARQAFQMEARSAAPAVIPAATPGTAASQPAIALPVTLDGQSELALDKSLNRPAPLKVQRLKNELREILGLLSQPVGKPRLVNRERKTDAGPQLFD